MTDRDPQTLAEVQKGDMVWFIPSITSGMTRGAPFRDRVTKTTKNFIYCKKECFSRVSGDPMAGTWGRIAVGSVAERLCSEQMALIKRTLAEKERDRHIWGVKTTMMTLSRRPNKETVIRNRKILDKAEAQLREMGEWTDDA